MSNIPKTIVYKPYAEASKEVGFVGQNLFNVAVGEMPVPVTLKYKAFLAWTLIKVAIKLLFLPSIKTKYTRVLSRVNIPRVDFPKELKK